MILNSIFSLSISITLQHSWGIFNTYKCHIYANTFDIKLICFWNFFFFFASFTFDWTQFVFNWQLFVLTTFWWRRSSSSSSPLCPTNRFWTTYIEFNSFVQHIFICIFHSLLNAWDNRLIFFFLLFLCFTKCSLFQWEKNIDKEEEKNIRRKRAIQSE